VPGKSAQSFSHVESTHSQPCGPMGTVLGWPKICKLARAFLWEYRYKRLRLAQLLGQLGVFLTCRPMGTV
jgi:hypothetical protein